MKLNTIEIIREQVEFAKSVSQTGRNESVAFYAECDHPDFEQLESMMVDLKGMQNALHD